MGTRNAEERRKAAGKHRKESFSVKREVVARYEPQAKAVELAQLGEGDSPQCGEMSRRDKGAGHPLNRGQAAPCREWIMNSNKNLRGTSNLLFAIQET